MPDVKGILGKKLGMTQIFDDARAIPATTTWCINDTFTGASKSSVGSSRVPDCSPLWARIGTLAISPSSRRAA